MNRLFGKLKSQMGETITEVLVALLISSLALIMLAAMISSTTKIVLQSREAMENYYSDKDAETPEVSVSITLKNGENDLNSYSCDMTPKSVKLGGKTVYSYVPGSSGGGS